MLLTRHALSMPAQVIQTFMDHSIDNKEDMLQAYVLGNRLSILLRDEIPQHPDFDFFISRESQQRLQCVEKHLEQLALLIDKMEHANYIGQVISCSSDEASLEWNHKGKRQVKISPSETSINMMLVSGSDTSAEYAPCVFDSFVSENSILSKTAEVPMCRHIEEEPREVPCKDIAKQPTLTKEKQKKMNREETEATSDRSTNAMPGVWHYLEDSSRNLQERPISSTGTGKKMVWNETEASFPSAMPGILNSSMSPSSAEPLINSDRSTNRETPLMRRQDMGNGSRQDRSQNQPIHVMRDSFSPHSFPLQPAKENQPDLNTSQYVSSSSSSESPPLIKPLCQPMISEPRVSDTPPDRKYISNLKASPGMKPSRVRSPSLIRGVLTSGSRTGAKAHSPPSQNLSLRNFGTGRSCLSGSTPSAVLNSHTSRTSKLAEGKSGPNVSLSSIGSAIRMANESVVGGKYSNRSCIGDPEKSALLGESERVILETENAAGRGYKRGLFQRSDSPARSGRKTDLAPSCANTRVGSEKTLSETPSPSTRTPEQRVASTVDHNGFPLIMEPSRKPDTSGSLNTSAESYRSHRERVISVKNAEMLALGSSEMALGRSPRTTNATQMPSWRTPVFDEHRERSCYLGNEEQETFDIREPMWASWSDVDFSPPRKSSTNPVDLEPKIHKSNEDSVLTDDDDEWLHLSSAVRVRASFDSTKPPRKILSTSSKCHSGSHDIATPRSVCDAAKLDLFSLDQRGPAENTGASLEGIEAISRNVGNGTQLLFQAPTPEKSTGEVLQQFKVDHNTERKPMCLPSAILNHRIFNRTCPHPAKIYSPSYVSHQPIKGGSGITGSGAVPRRYLVESESNVELLLNEANEKVNRRCRLDPLACPKYLKPDHEAEKSYGPVDLDDSQLLLYDDNGNPRRGCVSFFVG